MALQFPPLPHSSQAPEIIGEKLTGINWYTAKVDSKNPAVMSINRLGTILHQFSLSLLQEAHACMHILTLSLSKEKLRWEDATTRNEAHVSEIGTEQPTPKLGFKDLQPPSPVSDKVADESFLPRSQDADPCQKRCRGCDWCPDGWGLNRIRDRGFR